MALYRLAPICHYRAAPTVCVAVMFATSRCYLAWATQGFLYHCREARTMCVSVLFATSTCYLAWIIQGFSEPKRA